MPPKTAAGFAIRAIHLDHDPSKNEGALTPPLHLTSTLLPRCSRMGDRQIRNIPSVALSPSPCPGWLRLLEQTGVIKSHTAIVDEKAYGLPITAFVRIRLERHSEEVVAAFERKIRSFEAVLDCYVMTGTPTICFGC